MENESRWIRVSNSVEARRELSYTPKQITVAYADGQLVRSEKPRQSSGSVETFLLGTALGAVGGCVLGNVLGKKNGWQEGYNQARAEDSSAIQQLEQSLQQANTALYNAHKTLHNMRQERDQHLQEIQRLSSENEVLKALVREHPTSAQTETILKALQRVEFHLTEMLPPLFEAGGDGQNPGQLN